MITPGRSPPKPRGSSSTTISGELLVSTALLFGAALLVAVLAGVLVLPYLESAGAATLFLGLLVAADLAILFLFLRHLLRRSVLTPLREIGEHTERIAAGDFEHRIPATGRDELDRMVGSVNAMARRLIRDQRLLEENVRSLEETNRELVDTTNELIRTARMASVGTLAAGIAHELGNPLGALRTSLDVARSRMEAGGNVDEALQAALEEAGRIDAIIRSVLEFVRPSREDGGDGAPTVVEPVSAVERAVDLLERRGALDGVSVRIETDERVPPVQARGQLLEQVLVNLLMNAVQAGGDREVGVRVRGEEPPGGRPTPRRDDDPPGADYSHRRRMARLRRGEPAVEVVPREVDVVLEVLDRGPGVDEDHLERIFDPFFTTRAPGEGTGMGLAITVRIVQELGGELDAENREGGGACFRVRLPAVGPDGTREGERRNGDAGRRFAGPESGDTPGEARDD